MGYTNRDNNTPGAERGRGGAAGGAPAGTPPGGGRGGRGGGGGGGGSAAGPFSADSKFAFVMVTTQPRALVDSAEAEQRARAGRGTVPAAGAPNANATANNSLRVIRLADGNMESIKGARWFRTPSANGKWLAYAMTDPVADSIAAATGGRGGRGGRDGAGVGAADAQVVRRTYGTPLMLRNLDTGAEDKLADVASYTFDDSAKVLAYTVTSRDSTRDGVYLRDLNTGTTRTVMSGPGNYRAFTFDRVQSQFVFATDKDEFGRANANSAIYIGP